MVDNTVCKYCLQHENNGMLVLVEETITLCINEKNYLRKAKRTKCNNDSKFRKISKTSDNDFFQFRSKKLIHERDQYEVLKGV